MWCERGPSAPLTGTCEIRYFEAWNEFNDWYWTSNYTDMAKMANDAAVIVKQYCGDCVFMAGNTSAGGDGYNPNYIKNPIVSPYFDVALGQLLDAWHAIPNASLPDAVSYHAYGARSRRYSLPISRDDRLAWQPALHRRQYAEPKLSYATLSADAGQYGSNCSFGHGQPICLSGIRKVALGEMTI